MQKLFLGIVVLVVLLIGCNNNETTSIQGEIYSVDRKKQELIIYVEDTLTNSQRETMDFDKEEKIIEAFLIKAENAGVTGDVMTLDELKNEQKVTVEITGKYKKELVTVNTLFDEIEKLPVYDAEKVTVTPYSKDDLVEEMTVEKGKYALYIYNPKPNEEGLYSPPDTMDVFHQMSMITSPNEVKNTKQLLELYANSPTYIVTNHEGIIYKTDDEEEMNDFARSLEKKEIN